MSQNVSNTFSVFPKCSNHLLFFLNKDKPKDINEIELLPI